MDHLETSQQIPTHCLQTIHFLSLDLKSLPFLIFSKGYYPNITYIIKIYNCLPVSLISPYLATFPVQQSFTGCTTSPYHSLCLVSFLQDAS